MTKEKMQRLKEIYPAAPDEALEECLEKASKYGLDPVSKQIYVYESDALNRWATKITRQGYRKIAAAQPGYQGHHYINLYRGDSITVKDNDLLLEMKAEARTYDSLLAGVGWLYDSGRLHIVRLSYSDYCTMGYAWDQKTGRPDRMMQKEAEIQVIQKAYAHLFWDDPAEEQDIDDDVPIGGTRADILQYIKDNIAYITTQPKQSLNKCQLNELLALKDQIMKNKEKI